VAVYSIQNYRKLISIKIQSTISVSNPDGRISHLNRHK
jgi:hypothetical protein